MRFWLIGIGEPVPVPNGPNDRLHRCGYFANYLSGMGHEVVWWTSTFDHFRKKHHYRTDTGLSPNDRLQINLLHGCGYKSNLSLARIIDHRSIARKFAARALSERERPDLIISSFPPIELCVEAVRFGKKNGIPVVLDMRDMWPDIFIDHVPKPLRSIARLIIAPLLRNARHACAEATAIYGITDAFVEWGLRRGNRQRGDFDRSFPFGYISVPPDLNKVKEAEEFWNKYEVPRDDSDFIVCFLGTISHQFDIGTIINSSRELRKRGLSIRFVICGTGDRLEHYKRMAADDPNVIFPGWIDAAQIYVLMRRSLIGLSPLPDRYDYLATINNKSIEYMSAGLPILSCPDRGVLCDFLKEHQCGKSYLYGDWGALADFLAVLHNDRETLRRLSENSIRVFVKHLAAEIVYEGMMNHSIHIAKNSNIRCHAL